MKRLNNITGFLAAGLPAFLLAVPLNLFLVEVVQLSRLLAYALVLMVQVSINFFMCRRFVFTPGMHKTMHRQFVEFLAGILGFRVAGWLFYGLLVEVAHVYYILAQVLDVLVFAVLKYAFARKVIEG